MSEFLMKSQSKTRSKKWSDIPVLAFNCPENASFLFSNQPILDIFSESSRCTIFFLLLLPLKTLFRSGGSALGSHRKKNPSVRISIIKCLPAVIMNCCFKYMYPVIKVKFCFAAIRAMLNFRLLFSSGSKSCRFFRFLGNFIELPFLQISFFSGTTKRAIGITIHINWRLVRVQLYGI